MVVTWCSYVVVTWWSRGGYVTLRNSVWLDEATALSASEDRYALLEARCNETETKHNNVLTLQVR